MSEADQLFSELCAKVRANRSTMLDKVVAWLAFQAYQFTSITFYKGLCIQDYWCDAPDWLAWRCLDVSEECYKEHMSYFYGDVVWDMSIEDSFNGDGLVDSM